MAGIALAAVALLRFRSTMPPSRSAAPTDRKAISMTSTPTALQQVIDQYQRDLQHLRREGRRDEQARILTLLGAAYHSSGNDAAALEAYDDALGLLEGSSDGRVRSRAVAGIGVVYLARGEPQQAMDRFNEALQLSEAAGDRPGIVMALNNIGAVYKRRGEAGRALEYYERALDLRRQVGSKGEEATQLHNIATVHHDLSDYRIALEYYNQALEMSRAAGDRFGEAITLNSMGLAYRGLGEGGRAAECYRTALSLRRAIGDRAGESTTLNNLGLLSLSSGEWQGALDYYNQSLALSRAIGDRDGEAKTLVNLSEVYLDLGDARQALSICEQALPIVRARGDREAVLTTLIALGRIRGELGENEIALQYYSEALPISRATGNRWREAITLANIGAIYDDQSDWEKALQFYNQGLAIDRAIGHRLGEALVLTNIGGVYDSMGQYEKALEYHRLALPIRQAVGDRPGEANTRYWIAEADGHLGRLDDGIAQIEAAIEIIESLRTKVASQELRSSYFASIQEYYELYIDLLMRLHDDRPGGGYNIKALQASERGRTRSLLDILIEAGADIRQGVDSNLLARERAVQQRLNRSAETEIRTGEGTLDKAHARARRAEIAKLAAEYQEIEAEIRRVSPRYAALTQPQPASLREIQAHVLDPGTVLVEYALGRTRSYVWVVRPGGIDSYELPARIVIEDAAREVHDLLTARNQRRRGEIPDERQARVREADRRLRKAAADLSETILGPVAPSLGSKRLLIVGDGALQYVPFGMLPIPEAGQADSTRTGGSSGAPLVLRHEIVSLPSASALAVLRRELQGRRPAPKAIAVLADPVFDGSDERVVARVAAAGARPQNADELRLLEHTIEQFAKKSSERRIPRLPFTRLEAERILALVPEADRKSALDFHASRITATAPELANYRFIHFATHGYLDSELPELSALVLSLIDERGQRVDGFLRAHEIYNLKLPADVVVLSACETALGKQIRGEGLIGLTRGFMYAGTARVVASLWSVNDEATAELMTGFYRRMIGGRLRPAAALRQAQIDLLGQTKWQAPYYWAAFVLQGEWR